MRVNISFDSIEIARPALDYRLLKRWIQEVAARHSRTVGTLSYLFCDDETMLDYNRRFLGHDYYTDIITFHTPSDELLIGDMIISLDTVRTNAEKVGATYLAELHRVIIHGVLHLCGINDKGPGEREIMEQHENEALELLQMLENEQDEKKI